MGVSELSDQLSLRTGQILRRCGGGSGGGSRCRCSSGGCGTSRSGGSGGSGSSRLRFREGVFLLLLDPGFRFIVAYPRDDGNPMQRLNILGVPVLFGPVPRQDEVREGIVESRHLTCNHHGKAIHIAYAS